jgi:hypothetical protein
MTTPRFIETVRNNELATFVRVRAIWNLLEQIDGTFRRAIDGMHNARAWFEGFFLLRAHAVCLGGVRFSASAQLL